MRKRITYIWAKIFAKRISSIGFICRLHKVAYWSALLATNRVKLICDHRGCRGLPSLMVLFGPATSLWLLTKYYHARRVNIVWPKAEVSIDAPDAKPGGLKQTTYLGERVYPVNAFDFLCHCFLAP